jgi:hypothetical protein
VVLGAVAEGDQRHVPGRDHEQHYRAGGQHHDRGIEHARRDFPSTLCLVQRQVLGQHGDERRADRPGEQQVEQQVRHAEGDPVVIELVTGAERVGDNEFADGPQDPTETVSDQDERRGRRDAPPLARHRTPLSPQLGESRVGRRL